MKSKQKKGKLVRKPLVFLAGDHAGFKLKEKLKEWLESKGYEVIDFGPKKYDKNDDYPDFVIPMAKSFVKEKNKKKMGIIIAGSGQGEAIAINKIRGIRAALYYGGDMKMIKTTREHNDSNILSFGARFISENEAKKAINLFMKTPFGGGRHKRRLNKYARLGSK